MISDLTGVLDVYGLGKKQFNLKAQILADSLTDWRTYY